MKYKYSLLAIFLSCLIAGCGDEDEEDVEYYEFSCSNYTVEATNPLANVRFFAYQIQDISDDNRLQELISSKYDLLVIEPTRTDVTGDVGFDTKGAVTRLKNSLAHNGLDKKLVLAYIDIGEVEDWRWYWSWSKVEWDLGNPKPADWPDYIVKPDPDGWSGNYPVAYWDEDWKDIVINGLNTSNPYGDYTSILDEVLDDGFDGVYLDWVEGYKDSDIENLALAEGKNAAEEMVKFIREINEYGKTRNPNFIVVQQNAAELIVDDPTIVNYINGISQEAIWYDGFGGYDDWDDEEGYDVLNDIDLSNYYLEHLEKYMKAGLPVWNVEYAFKNADKAYELSSSYCFIPHCTQRSLARISTTPPPGY